MVWSCSPWETQGSSPTSQLECIIFLWCSTFFMVQLSHPHMTTGKMIALTRWTFVGKSMSLLFNTLSRYIIAFLSRNKCLLISWLQSLSTVILEPKKVCHCFHFSPIYLPWSGGTRCHNFRFLNVELSQLFCFPISPSSRDSLVPLHFLPLKWYHLHIWGCWYFSWQSWFQLVLHPAQHFVWCTLCVS